jgi:16S rRNA (guanine966-N2)-methyltransferase
VRVVAGSLRGRRIVAPEGPATRPTTDKVREAVFNSLASADRLEGARVADLYAGSGALGIEALSRGAAHCTFVERDRSALRALRENLAALGLEGVSRVVTGDALVAMPSLTVDLVFADPPYDADPWERLLTLSPADLVVAESGREVEPPAGWEVTRAKRYGRSWVTFLERVDR